jgi:membrane protease YdiL (CAAX protease family)
MMDSPADQRRNITAIAFAFEGGLGILALTFGLWLDHWPLPGVELTAEAWPAQQTAVLWGIAATVPMLLGMWLGDRFAFGPLLEVKRDVERLVVPMFANCSILDLALISLAAGFGEEMLFRGLLQSGLAEWLRPPLGPWVAVLAASFAFGLVHMVSTAYAVLATLIGVYLGVLLLCSGNLLTPVVAHGLYDFIALLYLVRFRGGQGDDEGRRTKG